MFSTNSPRRKKMILLFILCILVSVNGSIKVNHSIAQNECKQYGGIALYKDFDKHEIKFTISDEDAMTLTEGESAWIQGFANFTILSWFGCFKMKTEGTSRNISENNKYTCSKHCVLNTNNTKYIALRANVCFCLTFDNLGKAVTQVMQADNTLYGATDNACTLNSGFNVFEIHDSTKMHWEKGSVGSQQCVFAIIQGNERKSVSYKTDSCFSSKEHGFICVNSYGLTLNTTRNMDCEKLNDTYEICFASKNTSWLEAKQQCCKYRVKLIAEVSRSVRTHIDTNRTYWTGMFRPFSFQNVSTSSCLSATRVNNTLVLDPDNCSNKKRFLCRYNITQIKVTTPSFTMSSVNTESTNQTSITATSFNTGRTEQTVNKTTVISNHNETNSVESKYYIYIGIGVSVLFIVVLTIIIIVYKVRKNNMKTEGDAQTFENNVVCIEPDNRIDSKDMYVSCVEDKFENKTKDICMQDYGYDTTEQYSVVNPKKSTEETEYDRVHLVSQNKGKKTENVDGNIYDLTNHINDQDPYNVLGNINLNKPDDTYGKLQTKESTYDTMAQVKALTTSFDTYAHLS